ncbi:MAG: threonylcarbamoyl-AMP synthase [Prevotellaceae bacterium]|jgi:tRNA threonylcarbamoyl adenosine modification protein (Sua5/YciO/YrdC/YwlC family)|nr:threonylcarbamoyl-AMP synthase [Prevotellaceae bacterium]
MLIKIYPENPNKREINQMIQILENDGIAIYPTDTVYAMGCSLNSKKALTRLMKIKGVNEKNANFSLICSDLSHLSDYARVDNHTFKLLKKNLPGAFTFILQASNKVPDKFMGKRKTIGLRIPNNSIVIELVKNLGQPLLTTSIKSDDEILEYITDPELIHENYENLVDVIIDGGYGGIEPSTIVDCTGDEPEIIRQGKGELNL